jgi:hypothetical protein
MLFIGGELCLKPLLGTEVIFHTQQGGKVVKINDIEVGMRKKFWVKAIINVSRGWDMEVCGCVVSCCLTRRTGSSRVVGGLREQEGEKKGMFLNEKLGMWRVKKKRDERVY